MPFGSLTTDMDAADKFIYDEQMQVCEHVLGEAKKQSTANVVA